MDILGFTVNPFQENSYLISHQNRAIVIDPGFSSASEINIFLQSLMIEDAKLEAIVLSHAHLDHIFGVEMVRNRFEVPVYLHPDDMYFWENYMLSAARYGIEVKPFDFDPLPINTNEIFEIAGMKFEARHTPGHAPGHVAFYSDEGNFVVSGDALFRESIGRTDLYKGDFDVLENSIRTQLYTLPEETVVYPGHGDKTTIGHEKRHNPFVKG